MNTLTGSHGFAKGPCNPENKAFCVQKLREGIDLAVKFEAPAVITFTGTLEAADAVNGPYAAVAGATSPRTVPLASAAAKFYRSKQ